MTTTTKIDYDLQSCFEHNDMDFPITDIVEELAVHEGEKDERTGIG